MSFGKFVLAFFTMHVFLVVLDISN